jgi:hypothetical protein
MRWKFYPIFELYYNHTPSQLREEKSLADNYLAFGKYYQKLFNYKGVGCLGLNKHL